MQLHIMPSPSFILFRYFVLFYFFLFDLPIFYFLSHIFQGIRKVNISRQTRNIKCGVIKQNQFEVDQIQFSFFFKLNVCTICTAAFCRNPRLVKLVDWFQRYEQLKDAKNSRKQKTFSALFGSILKEICQDFCNGKIF